LRWNHEIKRLGLVVFTGLTVAWVRQGLGHHWKWFASWEDFFLSWFIYTQVIAFLAVFAGVAIIGTHRIFVGSEYGEDYDKLIFYIVMTALISAIFIAVIWHTALPNWANQATDA
jgi:hypothetical protein